MDLKKQEITFMGKTYRLEDLKAGIQKKDFGNISAGVLNIFNAIDKENANGLKNSLIDENERLDFWQKLTDFAGNKTLSEKEAQNLLKAMGAENSNVNDLKTLLDTIENKSNEILNVTHNKGNNSTVIEYKEGYFNEILQDGTRVVKPMEGKDNSLPVLIELNVPFSYMRDGITNRNAALELQKKAREADVNKLVEELGLKDVKADSRTEENGTKVESYKNDKGEEVLTIKNKGADNQVIEYKKDDNWYVIDSSPDIADKSITKYNSDKSKILDEVTYFNTGSIYQSMKYIPEKNIYQTTSYGRDGNISSIADFGISDIYREFPLKTQYFNSEGEVERIEIEERDPESNALLKTYIYDKDMNLKYYEIYDKGMTKKYDSNGTLIPDDGIRIDNMYSFSVHSYVSSKLDADRFENLCQNLEKDFNNPEIRAVLIDEVKCCKEVVADVIKMTPLKETRELKNFVMQMLDNCLTSDDPKEILKVLKLIHSIDNPRIFAIPLINQMNNETPNGIIDKTNYQGQIGDCWLLATINSISEIPELGNNFIKNLFDKDSDGNYIVKLQGGKVQYTITPDELNSEKYNNLSVGDSDLKLLEIAFSKYFEEFKPGGRNNLDGNWQELAMEILTGNKPLNLNQNVENNKMFVTLNNQDIELNEDNLDKLKEIPIKLDSLNRDTLKFIAKFKNRIAFSVSSQDNYNGHAFYVKDITENSITIKEPHNTGNTATYDIDDFLKVYTYGFTIMIL